MLFHTFFERKSAICVKKTDTFLPFKVVDLSDGVTFYRALLHIFQPH
jgi:hypothetical protein